MGFLLPLVPVDTPRYFKDILFTINYFKSSSGQASLFFKRLHFRWKVQRKALPSSLAASSLRAPCLPSKVTLGHPGSLLCCTGPRRAANPSPSKAPAGSTCLGFARGSSLFLDLIWQLPPPSDPTGRCCRWCEPRAPNLCRGPSGSDGPALRLPCPRRPPAPEGSWPGCRALAPRVRCPELTSAVFVITLSRRLMSRILKRKHWPRLLWLSVCIYVTAEDSSRTEE